MVQLEDLDDYVLGYLLSFLNIRKVERDIVLLNKNWKRLVDNPSVANSRKTLSLTHDKQNIVDKITDDIVIKLVRKYSNITHLNLDFCNHISNLSFIIIGYKCKQLISFSYDTYDNYYKDIGAGLVSIILYCTKLETISLDNASSINNNFVSLLGDMNGQTLQKFSFSNNTGISTETYIKFIKKCTNLVHIYLNDSKNITSDVIMCIANNCNKLKKLYIRAKNNTYVSSESIIKLSKKCPDITHLDLDNQIEITDETIIEVVKNCKNLVKLDLHNCSFITDKTVIFLATYCKHLEELDITGCNKITKVGLLEFTKNLTTINTLFYSIISKKFEYQLIRGCPLLEQAYDYNE